jgi:hypothetical protein
LTTANVFLERRRDVHGGAEADAAAAIELEAEEDSDEDEGLDEEVEVVWDPDMSDWREERKAAWSAQPAQAVPARPRSSSH